MRRWILGLAAAGLVSVAAGRLAAEQPGRRLAGEQSQVADSASARFQNGGEDRASGARIIPVANRRFVYYPRRYGALYYNPYDSYATGGSYYQYAYPSPYAFGTTYYYSYPQPGGYRSYRYPPPVYSYPSPYAYPYSSGYRGPTDYYRSY